MGPISKYLALFIGFTFSAMAFEGPTPGREQISVTATGTPSSFVNNVNVIFGNLLFAREDISASGPHSLPLIRYYNSQLVSYSWIPGGGMASNYPSWIVGGYYNPNNEYVYAMAEEDGGSIVRCVSKTREKNMSFYLDPETIHKGLTNASGEISARTNLKNIRLRIRSHYKESHDEGIYLRNYWKAFLSDGGEREYYSTKNFEQAMNIKSESRPDMTQLSFDYCRGGKHLGSRSPKLTQS